MIYARYRLDGEVRWGWVAGHRVGAIVGVAMAWWQPVRLMLSGIVEIFYPLPKSALIPVTVIWLGLGDGSKILLIFLGCMIPVTIGAFNGARSSEQTLVWSARSMGATRLRMLWDVVVPSALPELLNGTRTAAYLLNLDFAKARPQRLRKAIGADATVNLLHQPLGYAQGYPGAALAAMQVRV